MEILITYKTFILGVAAFFFFLMETIAPFREPTEQRWRHLLRNGALILGNTLVLTALYTAVLSWAASVAQAHDKGLFALINLPTWLELLLLFLLFDVVLYFWHRANHQIPFLWRFHKVHHADRMLDFSSAARFHCGELAISILIKAGFILLTGATFAQIVFFDILVTLFAMFNHSNIRLRGILEPLTRAFIVTPDMHRVHHSNKWPETDTNYCTMLSFWDRLFGSYCTRTDQENITIGLTQYAKQEDVSLGKLLMMPVRKD